MSKEVQPILLSGSSVRERQAGLYHEFPVGVFDPLLEEISERQRKNGIVKAVEMLLAEAAIAIRFVDTSSPKNSVREESPPVYVSPIQLGFNDHNCGTESDFKILINRHTLKQAPAQYVLLSPPNDDGTPSNLTFHKANFTFPNHKANTLEYAQGLPNTLKTAGNTHYYGRKDYDFYLFGNLDVPVTFSKIFENIGFGFDDQAYDFDFIHELRYLGGSLERHAWPGSQFAGQVALLNSIDLGSITK